MITQSLTRIGALLDTPVQYSSSIASVALNAEYAGVPDIFLRPNRNASGSSIYTLVQSLRDIVALPITVEFDSASVEQARDCIKAGADRIVVSTSALVEPDILSRLSNEVGRRSVVIGIETKRIRGREMIVTPQGASTGLPVFGWLGRAFQLGADGILLRGEEAQDAELLFQIANEFPASVAVAAGSVSPSRCVALADAGCNEIYVNVSGNTSATTVREWSACMNSYTSALPGEEASSVRSCI